MPIDNHSTIDAGQRWAASGIWKRRRAYRWGLGQPLALARAARPSPRAPPLAARSAQATGARPTVSGKTRAQPSGAEAIGRAGPALRRPASGGFHSFRSVGGWRRTASRVEAVSAKPWQAILSRDGLPWKWESQFDWDSQ